MIALNKTLLGALAVQSVLAAAMWWPTADTANQPIDWIPSEAATLASITIHGRHTPDEPAGPGVELTRTGDAWSVASSSGYPADTEKLTGLFDAIDALQGRTAIANNAHNHRTLDVADDEHTRKLTVVAENGQTTTLIVGAGQGRSAHVRAANDDDVYAVRGVSGWSIPDQASRFFDRDFVAVAPSEVASVSVFRDGSTVLALTRADGAWSLADTPEGQAVDTQKAETFVTDLLKVRLQEPEGTEVRPEHGFDQGVIVSWTTAGDAPTTASYTVGAAVPDAEGQRFVRADHSTFVVRAVDSSVRHALDKGPDAFLVDEPIAESE